MTTPYNNNLSHYANMCAVLHGYQVFKGARPIDKWEFYAEYGNNSYSAAQLLRQGKLIDYSIIQKDNWSQKKKMLDNN